MARIKDFTGHVAVRALARSVAVNMLAPAILYRLAAPHFPAASLTPLMISSAPPILALAWSLLRLRAVDFLGLFAVEAAACNVAALLLAHTEKAALVGRSLQNLPLVALFLGSLAIGRPLVLYMARQLATGNDPAAAGAFDTAAREPRARAVYAAMTWVWALALTVKCAGSVALALTLPAKDYLIASPLWDLLTDAALVGWSIAYGRARLAAAPGTIPATPHLPPVANGHV